MKLLDQLNQHAHLSPDEIVKAINNPFQKWRRMSSLTREEFERYRDTRVILYTTRSRNYLSHRTYESFVRQDNPTPISNWRFESWQNAPEWAFIAVECGTPFVQGVHDVQSNR